MMSTCDPNLLDDPRDHDCRLALVGMRSSSLVTEALLGVDSSAASRRMHMASDPNHLEPTKEIPS